VGSVTVELGQFDRHRCALFPDALDGDGASQRKHSVLRECQLAREMGLKWYFLGFYVRGNSAMAYKGRFFPRQILDWQSGEWNYRED
jgi:arginyl-tRNA--protein-N-Asp/Glu arginylyltransferase